MVRGGPKDRLALTSTVIDDSEHGGVAGRVGCSEPVITPGRPQFGTVVAPAVATMIDVWERPAVPERARGSGAAITAMGAETVEIRAVGEGTAGPPDPSKWGMSIDSVLARQAGVISRGQALAAGLTRDAVDHRVRLRRWTPLHPQVYLAAGHRRDDEVAVRGAALWAGEAAVLAGEAAAWWQGLVERPPPRIRLVVPRRRNPRARPGTEIRRRDLAGCDVVEHRGLLVTARPLTVLDTAVDLGPAGSRFLDRALQRTERFPAVYAAYCRNLGSAGSASAGQLLVAAADRSASVAERLLVRMLRRSGARGWHCGFPAAGYLIDIAFPHAMVAIEVDGWAWHMDAARTQADKWRQNALVRAGWTILRYTWHDLVERPRVVLAEIAHAVSRARAAG